MSCPLKTFKNIAYVFQQGHMKLHSGSMNQLGSSVSAQSSEGKVVEEPVIRPSNGKLQEEVKNSPEENTDKLSEHPASTTDSDDRP